VCAISIEEIWRGLRQIEEPVARRLFNGLRVAPLGAAEGIRAGTWRREFAAPGVTLHQADCLIAAAALGAGAAIATANVDDFPMEEIAVDHWPAGIQPLEPNSSPNKLVSPCRTPSHLVSPSRPIGVSGEPKCDNVRQAATRCDVGKPTTAQKVGGSNAFEHAKPQVRPYICWDAPAGISPKLYAGLAGEREPFAFCQRHAERRSDRNDPLQDGGFDGGRGAVDAELAANVRHVVLTVCWGPQRALR
jgi:predicted nucleic acid-binding protein